MQVLKRLCLSKPTHQETFCASKKFINYAREGNPFLTATQLRGYGRWNPSCSLDSKGSQNLKEHVFTNLTRSLVGEDPKIRTHRTLFRVTQTC